jgi:hypothetical protein
MYPYYFFSLTRKNWVKKNHLTGQAAANSTRDYLRVILFLASNSALLLIIIAGYAATTYSPDGNALSHLLTAKLGAISLLFLIIFFLLLYSMRYGLHFHMLMNVQEVQGVPIRLRIIEKVYHKSHFFLSSGMYVLFIDVMLC